MSVLRKHVTHRRHSSRPFGCLLTPTKPTIFSGSDEHLFAILVLLVLLGFRLLKYPMRHSSLALLSSLLLLSLPTFAFWPFKEKRFKDEAFINAGPLGLSKLGGRVAAIGDWDGDSKCVLYCRSWRLYWLCVRLDLFTLSDEAKTVQIHLRNGGWSYSIIWPWKIQTNALHQISTSTSPHTLSAFPSV